MTTTLTEPLLSPVQPRGHLVIDPCDGNLNIACATDVFSHIDGGFRNLQEVTKPTPETSVAIFALDRKNAGFPEMFGSFTPKTINQLCLTGHQIIVYCIKYRNTLKRDYTFFLLETLPGILVVDVDVRFENKLGAELLDFNKSGIWVAKFAHQVVIPLS